MCHSREDRTNGVVSRYRYDQPRVEHQLNELQRQQRVIEAQTRLLDELGSRAWKRRASLRDAETERRRVEEPSPAL
jgi:hypothetical protein